MSTLLGEARVRIRPDLTGFLSESQRGISGAGDQLGKTFSKALKVGAVAVAGISVAAAAAAKKTLDIGINYQNSLNTLQAVSSATQAQMRSVGATAKKLGNDITLPATSAADAAEAMTELAKASFTVADAQKAAKGSLQLAAAAQIGAADAAKIQANAIQSFSLKASDAGHVADVLANAANASSAEITDVADAMAQGGSVASSMKIPIEDFAATIGLLANNGIKGADAGTLLKSAILALQSPSKPAQKAMEALGLSAYDAHGNFVGLESIFGQLSKAQKRMTQEGYDNATSTLFGSDAARLAGVAAKTGADGFETMRTAMSRQGSAADVSAAKTKGLGGAIEAFKSQVETFQIDLYQRGAPDIEKLVRYAATNFPKVGDALISGIDKGVVFLGHAKDEVVRDAQAIARYFQPLTDEVVPFVQALASGNGPAGAFFTVLKGGVGVVGGIVKAAHPLVTVGGDLLHLFTVLPGPVQTAVAALAGLKILKSIDFSGFGKNAKGQVEGVTGAVRKAGTNISSLATPIVGFAQTARANMRLAGDEVGNFSKVTGGLSAAVQTYMPKTSAAVSTAMGSIKASFAEAKRDARFDIADQFGTSVNSLPKATGDIKGLSAAAKTAAKEGVGALKSGASGLLGVLGGPWGLAFTGATLAVSAISNQMQQAKDDTDGMAQAMLNYGQSSAQVSKLYKSQYGGTGPDWLGKVSEKLGFSSSLGDAQKKAADLTASMSPVERAQQGVTQATNQLNDALKNNPANSDAVGRASLLLRERQDTLSQAQQRVSDASKGATRALQDQAKAALAGTSTDIEAQFAQSSLTDEMTAYRNSLKDVTLTASDHMKSTAEMSQSATSAAQAIAAQTLAHSKATTAEGKQAEADAALLDSLKDTANQLGVATPKSILDLIASLSNSASSANATAREMSGLGLSVLSIPDQKSVIIDAPTAEQEQKLKDLGYTVTHLPDGRVTVTAAGISQADQAIQEFINKPRSINVPMHIQGTDVSIAAGSFKAGMRAAGGPIFGPGTATSDSIPTLLSNGEFVIKAKSVAKYGYGFLDAVNAGRFADGGAVAGPSAARLPTSASTRYSTGGSAQDGGFHLHVTVDESKAPIRDQIEEAMFQLRRARRGGVYA